VNYASLLGLSAVLSVYVCVFVWGAVTDPVFEGFFFPWTIVSNSYGTIILLPYRNKLVQNEFQRGEQLAVLLSRLGPTFIKVGQSLSIRTDLLSPAYVRGLASLQDQVPAFDTAIAKQILEVEWQRPVSDVIVGELTSQPIAAASLGQVYKATLKSTGLDVAIKVQRPNINEQIALDMHLLREAAPVLKRLFNLNSDTVGTVDAWGTGFVDELDYIQEARNGAFFSERIRQTPLRDVVLAPAIVEDFTTGSVLVTEWIDGERLDKSEKGDVTVLCSIAMNTYLTMLLELGLLHCDPHPGNLLRTPDGKLWYVAGLFVVCMHSLRAGLSLTLSFIAVFWIGAW
jgi:predicted unusual protein kinase regulating ubiquinone biosynthesis (AarF/ABC1/UbiB family)